jgi:hypothetical protein
VEVVALSNTRMWIGDEVALSPRNGMGLTELSNFILPKRARLLPDRVAAVAEAHPELAAAVAAQAAEAEQAEVPQRHQRHSLGSTPIA